MLDGLDIKRGKNTSSFIKASLGHFLHFNLHSILCNKVAGSGMRLKNKNDARTIMKSTSPRIYDRIMYTMWDPLPTTTRLGGLAFKLVMLKSRLIRQVISTLITFFYVFIISLIKSLLFSFTCLCQTLLITKYLGVVFNIITSQDLVIVIMSYVRSVGNRNIYTLHICKYLTPSDPCTLRPQCSPSLPPSHAPH